MKFDYFIIQYMYVFVLKFIGSSVNQSIIRHLVECDSYYILIVFDLFTEDVPVYKIINDIPIHKVLFRSKIN